jgi:hypothetical protein
MYDLQGPSKGNILTSPFEDIHYSPTNQTTLCTLPGVSYAQVTKQEFHAPTNIEQEPHVKQSHQQTNDMQELKNMKSLLPIVEINRLIPNHQFGFRQRHSTIEQTHQVIRMINEALDNKQYCSAAFLDISQAFGKVWHTGLMYK